MGLTAMGFVDELSSDSPAPGGGSVAALCGSLSGALSAMVAALTHSKKGYEAVTSQMDDVGRKGQELKDWFAGAVDRDTDAFNRVMDAFRLPKKGQEETAIRDAAIEEATKEAVAVPFSVLEHAREAARLADVVVEKGNANSLSDAGVASQCARLAAVGAYYNVMINLPGIRDREYVNKTREQALALIDEVAHLCEETDGTVRMRLIRALED